MWWRDRHIYHGRLLAAGHEEGINDMDLFDAACLVLAELHRLSEQTGFTYNSENVGKMKGVLAVAQRRPEDAVSEAKAMREEMERAAGVEPPTLLEPESAT